MTESLEDLAAQRDKLLVSTANMNASIIMYKELYHELKTSVQDLIKQLKDQNSILPAEICTVEELVKD